MKSTEAQHHAAQQAPAVALAVALALAFVHGLAEAQAATTWVKAVGEDQTFRVDRPTEVRYGVGTTWVQRNLNGIVNCSNSFFGRDPALGVVKSCEILTSSITRIAQAPAPVSTAWVRAANENQTFRVNAPTDVRYGVGTTWIYRSFNGTVNCTNGFFGRDPASGIVKTCQVPSNKASIPAPAPAPVLAPASAPPPIAWVKAVDENRTFRVNELTEVRFGVGTTWVQRSLNGTVSCTNSFFGRDPAIGVVKSCQIPSKLVTAPAPPRGATPTPTPTPAPAPALTPTPAPASVQVGQMCVKR